MLTLEEQTAAAERSEEEAEIEEARRAMSGSDHWWKWIIGMAISAALLVAGIVVAL